MRQFAARQHDFELRELHLVRVFHSPVEALRGYAEGELALPFPILADPGREVYKSYGVGGSLLALLRPPSFAHFRQAMRQGLRPRWRDARRDGIGGTPADFLIDPEGKIAKAHYGKSITDSLSPADALEWVEALP